MLSTVVSVNPIQEDYNPIRLEKNDNSSPVSTSKRTFQLTSSIRSHVLISRTNCIRERRSRPLGSPCPNSTMAKCLAPMRQPARSVFPRVSLSSVEVVAVQHCSHCP